MFGAFMAMRASNDLKAQLLYQQQLAQHQNNMIWYSMTDEQRQNYINEYNRQVSMNAIRTEEYKKIKEASDKENRNVAVWVGVAVAVAIIIMVAFTILLASI